MDVYVNMNLTEKWPKTGILCTPNQPYGFRSRPLFSGTRVPFSCHRQKWSQGAISLAKPPPSHTPGTDLVSAGYTHPVFGYLPAKGTRFPMLSCLYIPLRRWYGTVPRKCAETRGLVGDRTNGPHTTSHTTFTFFPLGAGLLGA